MAWQFLFLLWLPHNSGTHLLRKITLRFCTQKKWMDQIYVISRHATEEFYVHGSMHRKSMSIIVQEDVTIYSLFISVNCSTCFGWYLHPSSGVHITVTTASGTGQNTRYRHLPRSWKSWNSRVTVICTPDDGWRYHPKHVEQFAEVNKLYIVASCWTVIDIDLRCTDLRT